ncbi:MAG: choice-of-anchor Q domain-containing protein, partial [Planctomycetota bacterium]
DPNDPNLHLDPFNPDAIWIDGDYRLLPDSPCIDAGDPNYMAEPNEMDLDGKPRIIGCRIDMGAYEYGRIVPAGARIVPRTINLSKKEKWITAYLQLPEEYNVPEIDFCFLLLENEIEPELCWFDEQQQVVIARFNQEHLQGIFGAGEVELTITAQFTNATCFQGTDVIKVIYEGGKKLVVLDKATNPNPADGETDVNLIAVLSWTADSSAKSHDVYFGTSSSPPFICSQNTTTFDPGMMVYDTTYFWRIDGINKLSKTTGDLWSFTTLMAPPPPPPPLYKASEPNPADGAIGVGLTADLSWIPGHDAISHDVYFGSSNPPPSLATRQLQHLIPE